MQHTSAVAWGSNNLSVLARGEDNDILIRSWIYNPFFGNWNLLDWRSWGGTLTSGPDACFSGAGAKRIDVFARKDDGAIWHMYSTDAEFDRKEDVLQESLFGDNWDIHAPSAVAMFPAMPDIPPRTMKWEIANSGGIEIDPVANAWHAGRVTDMLRIKIHPFFEPTPDRGSIIVATPRSGVWAINLAGGESIPLSIYWENPNVTCLAFGPDGDQHIFAGCGNGNSRNGSFGGALYETDISDPLDPNPIYRPWRRISLDSLTIEIGSITGITILNNKRIIVLACWGGVIWSPIPGPGGIYFWKKAVWSGWTGAPGLGPPPPCFSVTLGPDSTIIVGAWATDKEKRGIFLGRFVRDLISPDVTLYMDNTTIPKKSLPDFPYTQADMARVSVASCKSQPSYIYALSTGDVSTERSAGHVNMVLRSLDGGENWEKWKLKNNWGSCRGCGMGIDTILLR